MSDEFRPREHDHLVEPIFGGLGAKREESATEVPEPSGFWRRLWLRIVEFLGRRASG